MSERMERACEATDVDIDRLRQARARTAADQRAARFLELRKQGVPSEKAIAQVDREFGQ